MRVVVTLAFFVVSWAVTVRVIGGVASAYLFGFGVLCVALTHAGLQRRYRRTGGALSQDNRTIRRGS